MGKRKSERDIVERLILENSSSKAHDIAKESGLIDSMGYDRSVDYVKRVKRDMRKNGTLPQDTSKYATDEERLEDITKLFEIRQGKMNSTAAYFMLLLNCYYRLRSQDDNIHMRAIDDTYEKNAELEEPFPMSDAIRICEKALALYMQSIDEDRNKAAKAQGYPGAGLNYTNESLIDRCEITETEINSMQSIRRNV